MLFFTFSQKIIIVSEYKGGNKKYEELGTFLWKKGIKFDKIINLSLFW